MQQPAALSFKITSKEKITPVSDTVGTAGSPTSVTFTLSVPSAYPQLHAFKLDFEGNRE